MRDILFRGKCLASNEWVYGFYRCYKLTSKIFDPITNIENDVEESTVSQYIGLNDKNGKKIFEGDIMLDYEIKIETLQDISGKLHIAYDVTTCCFAVDTSFIKDRSYLINMIEYLGKSNLEVIGSIYDKS